MNNEKKDLWVLVDAEVSMEEIVSSLKLLASHQEVMMEEQGRLTVEVQGLSSELHQFRDTVSHRLEQIAIALQTMSVHLESGNVTTRMLKNDLSIIAKNVSELESRVVEKDIRTMNRNIRTQVPFTFNAQKTPNVLP